MAAGDGLVRLAGYPFEVRHSTGAKARATATAQLAVQAYAYFTGLCSGVKPDTALIAVDETDWPGRQPYGLPFLTDDADQIQPGLVFMPAGRGEFWTDMVRDLRDGSPDRYPELVAVYPDGVGGVDLQPLFGLITIHELTHAFEVLGDLRLPTAWRSEIFVNLALHAFIAIQLPSSLPTLETLPTIGAESPALGARMRADGYTTLEELEQHYTGGEDPMSALNYAWFQYRWQRLAAETFRVDGEQGLTRLWSCFHAKDRLPATKTATSLAPLLSTQVSRTLGQAIAAWR